MLIPSPLKKAEYTARRFGRLSEAGSRREQHGRFPIRNKIVLDVPRVVQADFFASPV